MIQRKRKALIGRAVGAVALLALAGVASFTAGGSTAGADPKQLDALEGVGSDTTQDVMNALAGEANGNLYTPVRSSQASGHRQIISMDATNPDPAGDSCVAPKVKYATVYRANGSGSGQKALSRSIDGGLWGTGSTCAGSQNKSLSGLVDFGRSSSGPSAVGTDLTFVPFGRDALGYSYYATGAATPVTDLSYDELHAIFTASGSGNASGGAFTTITRGAVTTKVFACDIQTGSGTRKVWYGKVGATDAGTSLAATVCNGSSTTPYTGGRIQENDTIGLKAKGDAIATAGTYGADVQVIIGMSAAGYIAQANNVAHTTVAAGVGYGSVTNFATGAAGTAVPAFTGSAPSLAPNAAYYSSAFGRDVYNVFDTNRIADPDIASLFVGSTSAVCSATTIIETFGFKSLGVACGATTVTGPLVTGTL
jgi:ABC-type phosphate transport system substrate-binding protein